MGRSFLFALDYAAEESVSVVMTKAANAEIARDALLELITDHVEQALELLASEGREGRSGELAALTQRLALFGRAAEEAHALS